jgi:CHAT domain-containing protein
MLRPELLTDQALVLAQGEEVSVSDIFGLTLDTASHITLVACESAVQGVAKADEPLGLVTALLCAGAGSVLGTLWPIASMPGRLFAEVFYANVLRQIQEGAGRYGVVDLAKTLRKVVLDLRTDKRTRKPYHWAPFVLHGSPVLRQPSS